MAQATQTNCGNCSFIQGCLCAFYNTERVRVGSKAGLEQGMGQDWDMCLTQRMLGTTEAKSLEEVQAFAKEFGVLLRSFKDGTEVYELAENSMISINLKFRIVESFRRSQILTPAYDKAKADFLSRSDC